MKTFVQNGDVIAVTAPSGGVQSGDGIIVGSLFGVAVFTAAEDEAVEIATTGVYELPKDPTAVIAVGDRVSWDDAAKQVKPPAVGLYPVGIATEAAGSGASSTPARQRGGACRPSPFHAALLSHESAPQARLVWIRRGRTKRFPAERAAQSTPRAVFPSLSAR